MFDTKGYTTFGVIIVAGIFLVVWLLFLGSWMNEASGELSDSVNNTGLEGFLADNFTWMIFGLFVIAVLYFGARAS